MLARLDYPSILLMEPAAARGGEHPGPAESRFAGFSSGFGSHLDPFRY